MITVWSERRAAGPPFTACVYAGYLMAFDYGGFVGWPLGHHTEAELSMFERGPSDVWDPNRAHLAGADAAALARYDYRLWPLNTDLPTALATPGLGVALGGLNARWPRDSYQRRWDRAFEGNHFIFVVGWRPGTVMMFDPLAPMGYPGDEIEVAKILAWAHGGGAGGARRVGPGWYAPTTPPVGSPPEPEPVPPPVLPPPPIIPDLAGAAAGATLAEWLTWGRWLRRRPIRSAPVARWRAWLAARPSRPPREVS